MRRKRARLYRLMALALAVASALLVGAALFASTRAGVPTSGASPAPSRPPSSTSTAFAAGDVPIGSLAATRPQAGVSIAVDPGNDRRVVAAMNDYNSPAGMSTAYSRDGGRSWTAVALPRAFTARAGDPELAFAGPGLVYLAGTRYSRLQGARIAGVEIALFISTDGGRDWRVLGLPSRGLYPDPAGENDNPGLAIGGKGTIYLSWAHYTRKSSLLSNGMAMLAVSHDGGRHFVLRSTIKIKMVEGAVVGVDGGGAGILAFEESWKGYIGVLQPPNPSPVRVSGVAQVHNDQLPGLRFRVSTFPRLAVDRDAGTLCLTWVSSIHDVATVLFSISGDAGLHWSPPRPVDAHAGNDTFLPTVAISPAGVIGVVWYEREGASRYNTFLALFDRCGEPLSDQLRLNSAVSDLAQARYPTFLGDYTGLAFGAGMAHAAWTDLRQPMSVIYTRALPAPSSGACHRP